MILVLAFYPQFVLKRTEPTLKATIAPRARSLSGGGTQPDRSPDRKSELAMTVLFAATQHIKGPHIDWASLSPFIALTVGALVVLLVGLLRASFVRERRRAAADDRHARA